ncbi:MAG: hypothetical protein H6642_04475 [Caldilineaceae bacterium]|nr:hypothetical protein [Caldilineaceae bacterium]
MGSFVLSRSLWTLPTLLLFLLCACAAISAQADPTDSGWVHTNPGGGGSFGSPGAGPTGVMLVGSDLSGAYISRDHGVTWENIGADRGLTSTHVSATAFDPQDEVILYLGTDNGLFRSRDGGASFQPVLDQGFVSAVAVAAADPRIGYAAVHPAWNALEPVVYRTEDRGLTWQPVSLDLPQNLRVLDLMIDPQKPDFLYLLSGSCRFVEDRQDEVPAAIYVSDDGGVHWQALGPELGRIMDFAVHSAQPDLLYAAAFADYTWGNSHAGALWRSRDRGATWEKLTEHSGYIWLPRDRAETVRLIDARDPSWWNEETGGVWESADGGDTWAQVSDSRTWDLGRDAPQWHYGASYDGLPKTFGQDLSDSDRLLWVNSQWVFGTRDGGRTFDNLYFRSSSPGFRQSTGIDNTVMFDLEISPANPQRIYLGLYDMGCWRSEDGGSSWQSCNTPTFTQKWQGFGGNVTTIVADPERGDAVWLNMAGDLSDPQTLVRSDAGGAAESWQAANAGLPVSAIHGLSLDPNSPTEQRTLFVTAQGDVYRSRDDGYHWEQVFACQGCRFTAVDHFDGDWVYAGGENGLWRSTQGGAEGTWQRVGGDEMRGPVAGDFVEYPWEWGGVFDIQTDLHASGVVWVTVLGSGRGLYRSRDGGETWQKLWTDDYMRKIALSPQDPDMALITSSSAMCCGGYSPDSHGALLSTDRGVTWTPVNEGLSWPFALAASFDPGQPGRAWLGSPGTGFARRTFYVEPRKRIYLPLVE